MSAASVSAFTDLSTVTQLSSSIDYCELMIKWVDMDGWILVSVIKNRQPAPAC
jgi:hypothetical protein